MTDIEQTNDTPAFPAKDGIFLERIWPPGAAPQGWFSQLGGCPNLPPDFSWPLFTRSEGTTVPLDFLAQISLSDLPDVPDRDLLPAKGHCFSLPGPLPGNRSRMRGRGLGM